MERRKGERKLRWDQQSIPPPPSRPALSLSPTLLSTPLFPPSINPQPPLSRSLSDSLRGMTWQRNMSGILRNHEEDVGEGVDTGEKRGRHSKDMLYHAT